MTKLAWIYVICIINWAEDSCEPVGGELYETYDECHAKFVENVDKAPLHSYGHRCYLAEVEVEDE